MSIAMHTIHRCMSVQILYVSIDVAMCFSVDILHFDQHIVGGSKCCLLITNEPRHEKTCLRSL